MIKMMIDLNLDADTKENGDDWPQFRWGEDDRQIKSDKRKASDWAESHKTSQSHATIAKNDTFGLFCCPSLCLFGILEQNPKLALN